MSVTRRVSPLQYSLRPPKGRSEIRVRGKTSLPHDFSLSIIAETVAHAGKLLAVVEEIWIVDPALFNSFARPDCDDFRIVVCLWLSQSIETPFDVSVKPT